MRFMTAALLFALAAPGFAQTSMLKPEPTDRTQPRQRLVTVFGTDPCPKSVDPDEIIVCSRRPDEERYRIPPLVRSDTGRPVGPNERNRKNLLGDATGGAGGGIGSCSAVGPGGASGCNLQMQNQYREEKKAGNVPVLPPL